eukprot:COSAG06_NODE_38360_length_424_cov_1.575385_1_plen_99_part_01
MREVTGVAEQVESPQTIVNDTPGPEPVEGVERRRCGLDQVHKGNQQDLLVVVEDAVHTACTDRAVAEMLVKMEDKDHMETEGKPAQTQCSQERVESQAS